MINQILAKLGIGDGSFNNEPDSRRKYIRHEGAKAEVEVANHAFNVHDWSIGGVCFDSVPNAAMKEGDRVNVTLRFRFPHETIHINKQAKIIRSARKGLAAEFAPLSDEERKRFDRVIDSLYAQDFLESQVA